MTTTAAPEPTPRAATGLLLIPVLALLTAVAPLSIDMYLPAFPEMADDLGSTAPGIQLTLTAFLIGLGLGQLFIGPLSDATGRRAPLLIGTFVCALAGIACALAPNAEMLGTARFVQGLSGAAGVVLARAIVTDIAEGARTAKLLGVLMVINVIAPVVAPLAGGAIIAGFGWRPVFWVLAALALIMFLGVLLCTRETLPADRRAHGGIGATFGRAREALTNRNYLGYLLTFCFAFAALFAYIAASPFVVQNVLGMSAGAYSLLFGVNALVITITSAISAALAGRIAYRRMIAAGLVAGAVFGIALLITALNGVPAVPTLVLFAAFQGSMGFVFANATTLALAETGKNAGTGSAFLGFLQFMLAAIISPLVGIFGESTATPMAVAMTACIALAVLAYALLTRPSPTGDDDPAAVSAEATAS